MDKIDNPKTRTYGSTLSDNGIMSSHLTLFEKSAQAIQKLDRYRHLEGLLLLTARWSLTRVFPQRLPFLPHAHDRFNEPRFCDNSAAMDCCRVHVCQ